MLTDLPIGAWSMSALLDTVGGRSAERSADLLMAAGVLAAVPTAASGLNDWSDTYGPDTRVGLVHARINTAALSLYVASLSSRAHGERTRGKIIGLAGLAVLTGAYLGGHLSFARGVNVNRTAWQEGPQDWTVLPRCRPAGGRTRYGRSSRRPVLLYRAAGTVWALANTCSHVGGPLDEGTIAKDCVTCPWHGSILRFADGAALHGPARSPQARYEARVSGDRIEVRVVA